MHVVHGLVRMDGNGRGGIKGPLEIRIDHCHYDACEDGSCDRDDLLCIIKEPFEKQSSGILPGKLQIGDHVFQFLLKEGIIFTLKAL